MQIKENMRQLLAEDKSILSRRDDFLNKLESLSTEPKDFAAIRRAVQSVNIAEMFLANDNKSLEVKKEAIKNIRAKLVDIGMQDARIDFIVDAFVYALNWEIEEKPANKNNAVIDKKVEKVSPQVSPKISLAKEENIPKTEIKDTTPPIDKNLWTCACGAENRGNFCSNCGKPFQNLQAKNEKKILDDIAEKFSPENIEKYIKDNQIQEKIQTAAKTAKDKISDAIEQALDTSKQTYDVQNVNNTNNTQNINTQNIQNTKETNISYSARDTRNSYFSFKGRMNRKAYCIMGLKCLGFYFLLGVFASFLVQEGSDGLGGFILLVATIAFAICNYSLTVRRLHDLNFSGWLAIIMFIPYVNLIAALFIILAPGTEGSNEYGEDPLRL